MSVKERIILFTKHRNLSNRAFEMNCGLSNGFISSVNDSISKSALGKITNFYPEINPTWLLTGEGKMLKTESPDIPEPNTDLITQLKDEIEQLKKSNDEKQRMIQKLLDTQADLIHLITGTHKSDKT